MYDDCFICIKTEGRCENGGTQACNNGDLDQFIAAADVKEVCYCKNNPSISPIVQAVGVQTGEFMDDGRKRKICQ